MHFKEIYPIDPILAQAIVAWVGLDKLKLILQEAKDSKDFIKEQNESGT